MRFGGSALQTHSVPFDAMISPTTMRNTPSRTPRIFALREYEPSRIPADALSAAHGALLLQNFSHVIDVQPPSLRTAGQWQLTSLGWVGHLHVSPDLQLSLQPRVPLRNLFGMWEYAYRLNIVFNSALYQAQSVPAFYEQLARVLALRVLDRARKGFARTYQPRVGRLGHIAGRLDLRDVATRPWHTQSLCHFHQHTLDIEDNQILAWTLALVVRNHLCSPRVQPAIRQAYRALTPMVSLRPFQGRDCTDRIYNRLNADYEILHALCRFFLDHTGPVNLAGDQQMLPFLVNMPALFERFVAEWLQHHLPAHLAVRAQESFGSTNALRPRIDLVIYDRETGRPRIVLDTKYKASTWPADVRPNEADVYQVMAYADFARCEEALLVYPTSAVRPFQLRTHQKTVRAVAFPLDGDLEAGGQHFLQAILPAS